MSSLSQSALLRLYVQTKDKRRHTEQVKKVKTVHPRARAKPEPSESNQDSNDTIPVRSSITRSQMMQRYMQTKHVRRHAEHVKHNDDHDAAISDLIDAHLHTLSSLKQQAIASFKKLTTSLKKVAKVNSVKKMQKPKSTKKTITKKKKKMMQPLLRVA